jgi:streptomycin 6-kinase
MSDEFDSLDAIERTGTEAALDRCRSLAAQIANELHNKRPEHFVDKLSLADFYASLERAVSRSRRHLMPGEGFAGAGLSAT